MFLFHCFACLALTQLPILSNLITLALSFVPKISSYFKRASLDLMGRVPHCRKAAPNSLTLILSGQMATLSLSESSHNEVVDNEMS